MGGSPGKPGIPGLPPALESKLLDIPEDKFVEVVRLLERLRDHPDVHRTFTAIRPRLAQLRPDRRPTLKRVLCMPFEDLLESAVGADLPVGRIERRCIEPVWRLVAERLDRADVDRFEGQIREAPPGSRTALLNVGRRLWPLASGILRDALADDGFLRDDPELRRPMAEVAALLDVGPVVESLKDDLSPKPLPTLDAPHIAAVERAAQAAARQAPEAVQGLLLVAASRLATPAELLTVLHDLDLGKARRALPELFVRLSGLVVGNLEERSARLDGAGPSPEDAVTLAERLIASVNTTSAVMDTRNEPAYRERLEAVTKAVGDLVNGSVLRTAPAGILAAVAVPPPGAAPAVDEDAQAAAEDHARALRRCVGLAGALGLQQPVDDTLKAMGGGLVRRARDLLDGYARMGGSADEAEAAEMNLFYALRLLEMVAGSAKAEPLRVAIMDAIAGRCGGEG